MGYVGLIRSEVQKALTKGKYLGNIPVEVTFYSGDEGDVATYDPVTQLVTRNETTGLSVDAVYSEAENEQIDNINVLQNDKFFYISDANLVEAGIMGVKPSDRIIFNGTTETVIKANTDPTHSLWVVQTRIP